MRLKWPKWLKWLSIILKPKGIFISVIISVVYTHIQYTYLKDDQQYEYIYMYTWITLTTTLRHLPITIYSSTYFHHWENLFNLFRVAHDIDIDPFSLSPYHFSSMFFLRSHLNLVLIFPCSVCMVYQISSFFFLFSSHWNEHYSSHIIIDAT